MGGGIYKKGQIPVFINEQKTQQAWTNEHPDISGSREQWISFEQLLFRKGFFDHPEDRASIYCEKDGFHKY